MSDDDPTLFGHEQAMRLLSAAVLGPAFVLASGRMRDPAFRAVCVAGGALYSVMALLAFLRARELAAAPPAYRYEPPVSRTI